MALLLRERPPEYVRVAQGRLPPLRQFVLVVDRLPDRAQLDLLPGAPRLLREPGDAVVRIRFDWPARTVADAVVGAVREVEALGIRAVRVDARDWVTLQDIADRIGRSRETVRLWSLGRMGPGAFPPPLNLGRDTAFYSWAEVLAWLRARVGVSLPEEEPVLAVANLVLQARALAPRVERVEALCGLLREGSPLDATPTRLRDDDVIEEA